MIQNISIARRLVIFSVFIFLVVSSAAIVSSYLLYFIKDSAFQMGIVDAALADATMEIKIELASGHIDLEEWMEGEADLKPEQITEHWDGALWYGNAILSGASDERGTFYAAKDEDVRNIAEEVYGLLNDFRSVAIARAENHLKGKKDEGVEARFHDLFHDLNLKLGNMEEVIQGYRNDRKEDIESMVGYAFYALAGFSAGLLLILFFFSVLLTRSIVSPLSVFRNQADTMATGDLTGMIQLRGKNELITLAERFNLFIGNLVGIVRGLKDASDTTANTSNDMFQSTRVISEKTQSQAAAMEEISASMEEISSQVENILVSMDQAGGRISTIKSSVEQLSTSLNQISGSTTALDTLSRDASRLAQTGRKEVTEATEAMDLINDNSSRIAEIVSLITEISDQTNLLALNAAIEAARAGDQGRGFAVVADEISKLADRTNSSVAEIVNHTDATREAVSQGTRIVKNVAGGLLTVVNSIDEIYRMSQSISQSVNSQTEYASTIGQIVNELSSMTDQNRMGADEQKKGIEVITDAIQNISIETSHVSEETDHLMEIANGLRGMTDQLQGIVNQFRVA